MFDDIVGKDKVPEKKSVPKKSNKQGCKGHGGMSNTQDYAWCVTITKDKHSIVEIILVDEIGEVSDETMDDIVKKLRRT